MKPGALSTFNDILHHRCPRCRVGRIFHLAIFLGVPKMYERCSVCPLRYEREPGYFLGAMYISYALALPVVAFIAGFLWAVTSWWITKATVWAVFLFLPLVPTITFLARVLWIYLDQTFDPERS